tara:strand:- start:1623 stop:2840 length:1218 start_codon:yes stop_codon:yes gene_type:complete
MGIDSTNGFSSNTDELINAANFYVQTVVRPFQLNILDTLQTIFSVNNIDLEVGFVQLKPITVQFDSVTVREVMTQDEIREDLGLPPLVTKEKNETTDALSTMSPLLANKVLNNLTLDETRDLIGLPSIDPSELPQETEETGDVAMCRTDEPIPRKKKFNKVGMIDGKPVFSTSAEAEEHAKTLGCTGYHEHEYEGETVYMACEGHSEATELSKFIAEFGEDAPHGYVLLDQEMVENEDEDFDFEGRLNDIVNKKYNFISTGRANPNARDDEDGLNKSETAFFKVRYRYTQISKNPKGSSRDFCRAMISADKLYRKRDIINMGSKAVNPGFGPRGADTYSIWDYKGGGACYHFWLREVYQADPTDDNFVYYPDNIDTDKLIKEVKAEGDAGTAPINMPNEAFLEPR